MAQDDITLKITVDDDGSVVFEQFAKKSSDAMGKTEKRMQSFRKGTVAGAKLIAKGLAVAATAVAGFAATTIKFASDFESSFAGVRKTVDATEEQFAKLAQGFRDMAKEIPIGVNELNKIGEAAGQLGIETDNILEFTEVMAKLGVTTNLSAEEAATSLARFSNIMGTSQQDFDRLGSSIVDLGNNFATTEAEIVEFGLRMAGAGNIIGLTEGEVLGLGTAMSSVGIQAEAGGTAMQKVMINIANAVAEGGEQLNQFAGIAGMASDAFQQMFKDDPAEALVRFVEGLGKAHEEGENVFGLLEGVEFRSVRVQRALLSAAGSGDLLRSAITRGNTAWEENKALTEEAAVRFETFASQMTLLKNNVVDIAIEIGQTLMPVALELVTVLRDAIGGESANIGKTFRDNLVPAINIASQAIILLSRAWTGWKLIIQGVAGVVGAFVGTVFGGLMTAIEKVMGGILAMSDVMVGLGQMSADTAIKIRDAQVSLQNLATDGFDFASGSIALMSENMTETLDSQAALERGVEDITQKLRDSVPATEAATTATEDYAEAATTAAEAVEDLGDVDIDWPSMAPPKDVPVLLDNAFKKYNVEIVDATRLTEELSAVWRSGQVNGKQMASIIESQMERLDRLGQLTPEVKTELMALARETGHAGVSFGEFFGEIRTGIPEVDGFLGKMSKFMGIFDGIVGALSGAGEGIGGFFSSLSEGLGGLFGGGGGGKKGGMDMGGLLGGISGLFKGGGAGEQVLNVAAKDASSLFGDLLGGSGGMVEAGVEGAGGFLGGLSGILSSVSSFMPIIGPLISAFGPLIFKGLKALGGKIWGGIKKLFGGPDAAELEGRKTASAFRDGLASMLSEGQMAEATAAGWEGAAPLVAVRDALMALGAPASEAEAAMNRLWEAEKQGAGAVEEVIATLQPSLDKVQAAMDATGLGMVELRDMAINASNIMGISVEEAFVNITTGVITTLDDAHAAAAAAVAATAETTTATAAAAVEATTSTATDAVNQMVDDVTSKTSDIEIDIPVKFDVDGFPDFGDFNPDSGRFDEMESFQTMPGQTRVVPGGPNDARIAMVHGGEEISRGGGSGPSMSFKFVISSKDERSVRREVDHQLAQAFRGIRRNR